MSRRRIRFTRLSRLRDLQGGWRGSRGGFPRGVCAAPARGLPHPVTSPVCFQAPHLSYPSTALLSVHLFDSVRPVATTTRLFGTLPFFMTKMVSKSSKVNNRVPVAPTLVGCLTWMFEAVWCLHCHKLAVRLSLVRGCSQPSPPSVQVVRCRQTKVWSPSTFWRCRVGIFRVNIYTGSTGTCEWCLEARESRRRAFWKTLCHFNDQTHQPLGFPPPFNRQGGKRLDIPSMPCPHQPYSTPLIFHPSTQKAFPLLPAPPPPSVLQSPKNCMTTGRKKRRVMARLVGALERRVEHLLLTAQSRERLAAQYVSTRQPTSL